MSILATPIEKLPFVGPRALSRLKNLGIKTVKDLLWHLPSRYEDFSQITPIGELVPDQTANVVGKLIALENQRSWKRRMTVTNAEVEDDTGAIRVVWFNQPYLEKNLPLGSLVSLAGKVKLDKKGMLLSSPVYEKLSTINYKLKTGLVHTGRLVPVYPETAGITSKYLRFLIKPALQQIKGLADPLPPALVTKYALPNLEQAIYRLHYPTTLAEAEQAKKRLAFDELFLFQLRSIINRRKQLRLNAPSIKLNEALAKQVVTSLPFTLTNDQRLAAFEILKDLERKYPMNRLLNGDVGSGKTVVALIAAYLAAQQGWQTIFMAPTEVLAQQHYQTITTLLNAKDQMTNDKNPITVGLLTANNAKRWPTEGILEEDIGKAALKNKIANGEIKIIIGTQAVLQKGVAFGNLALVVIDEQHRFGVEQRMQLVKSSLRTTNYKLQTIPVPHLLSMTATPIPRTLALTIYGDLDISLIKEKPAERKPIVTKLVTADQRAAAYQFIDQQIAQGRQVFVICPRIERPSPEIATPDIASRRNASKDTRAQRQLQLRHWDVWAEVKAVTDEFEKLNKDIFPHRKVAMLHGKLKPREKDAIMRDFKAQHYDILVSTSVIEVGIDIPNASIMYIENAERFGLAQLHQFRGRVGRGEHQSYCMLVNGINNQTENRRLKALVETNDGFKLAEADLLLRGPGEFIGTKQSGIPDLAMASLADLDLIKKARLEARLLIKDDPNLKAYPALAEKLKEFQRIRHFE